MPIIRKTVPVHDLKQGDTVEIGGVMETVSKLYIKYDSFLGYRYKGRIYRNGITRITFKVKTLNGWRYE